MSCRTSLVASGRPALLVIAALAAATACSTVDETGRRQLTFLPESMMASLGAQAYQEATSQYPTITGTPAAEMVQRVGRKIAAASGREMAWEYKLLDAPDQVNAFALPGGKVAVYSGILKVADTEDQLAAILGHEVAHATAHHGNERMSQNVLATVGMEAINLALGSWTETSAETRSTIMAALGAGTEVGVLLPYSREHESEADEIGTLFMIKAGYDPQAAVQLWKKMAQLSGGQGQPEILSTHPDPMKRAERLQRIIPELRQKAAAGRGTAPKEQPRY